MLTLKNLHKDVAALSDPIRKDVSQRFFKTGKGQYAEGDVFLGLTVPSCRKLALKYQDLPLNSVISLLTSIIHEERLIALLILVQKFQKGSEGLRKEIFEKYLQNTKYVNNWDLVDTSAPKILGEYLRDKNDREVLVKLAHSKNLWERRIAIIATFQFICLDKDSYWTFKIAKILLSDQHDLIQKAVGWMLREVGKRISQEKEKEFLDKHYKQSFSSDKHLGRTALRYSIEHFNEGLRQKYLKGEI